LSAMTTATTAKAATTRGRRRIRSEVRSLSHVTSRRRMTARARKTPNRTIADSRRLRGQTKCTAWPHPASTKAPVRIVASIMSGSGSARRPTADRNTRPTRNQNSEKMSSPPNSSNICRVTAVIAKPLVRGEAVAPDIGRGLAWQGSAGDDHANLTCLSIGQDGRQGLQPDAARLIIRVPDDQIYFRGRGRNGGHDQRTRGARLLIVGKDARQVPH